MGALDELVAAWRANPDADSTIALCSYLSAHPEEDLVREVGQSAETWHRNDPQVMLAAGRMFLDAGLLVEAQASLVTSGKTNPRDPEPLRYLGEVLLRRGDAARAEKVLARAMKLGSTDPDARLWHDRAVVYVALQKRVGLKAVAAEVARTIPKTTSIPPPTFTAGATEYGPDEAVTMPRAHDPRHELATQIVTGEEVYEEQSSPHAVEPPPQPDSPPVPASPGVPVIAEMAPPEAPSPVGAGVAPAPAGPSGLPTPPPLGAPGVSSPLGGSSAATPFGGVAEAGAAPGGAALGGASGVASPAPFGAAAPARDPLPAPAAQPAPLAAPRTEAGKPMALEVRDEPELEAGDLLEQLARVGVYEPEGGAPPAWEAATRTKSRGGWVFIAGIVVVLATGGGGYAYARHVRQQQAAAAEAAGDEIEKLLRSGKPADLKASNDKLSAMFDLDSRSQRAARLWLQNRVAGALILPGDAEGIDSALHRARKVEVPEEQLAFGRIASFLSEGDLAGAAAKLPEWDKRASKDPWYQLAAGAVLERAGDVRAIERYQAARALDDDLVLAHLLLAQYALLEVGPKKAEPALNTALGKLGDRPSARALRALNWAVKGATGEMPADAKVSEADREELPLVLRPVPLLTESLNLDSQGKLDEATKKLDEAVKISVGPAMATFLGFVAIDYGDAKLARQAALRALRFSAVYPRARTLAARVALLGGRLEEAKKAVENLDPKSTQVAVVRAAVAYEGLDTSELDAAAEVFAESKSAELSALGRASSVLRGKEYPEDDELQTLAEPSIAWGELIAVDAALDQGKLELAGKLVESWGEKANAPVYALRVARLERYRDDDEKARKAAAVAVENGAVTQRVLIETVLVLVDADDAKTARTVLAKYQAVLGPLSKWLSALVDAAGGKVAEANVKVAQLELPPSAAPMPIRVMVARALAAAGDKRGRGWAGDMARVTPDHPDVVTTAKAY